jgi:hypothetical protein
VQVIHAPAPFRLEVTDLSALPAGEREAVAARLTYEEAQRPFDLARGPLLRAGLLRLAEDDHVLLMTMHHIISDGWSEEVLVREVSALYRAFVAGEASPLAELEIQYADYASWQREWLQGEVLEAQLGYWRRQLEGARTVLELPLDRPRPPAQTYAGAKESVVMSEALTAPLRELSRREGATLFMTLLAAFLTLLHRHTGQNDILVGTPIANRGRSETEGLIGFFVNTLVLRGRVDSSMTFRELLAQVREVTLGAYTHQDVPFERLVEELQPERSLSHQPLFQAVFTVQNAAAGGELELPGLSLSPFGGGQAVAKFDLRLNVIDSGERLTAVAIYSTDLFEAATVARLLAHMERLLASVVERPDAALGELEIFSAEEKLLMEKPTVIEELSNSFAF